MGSGILPVAVLVQILFYVGKDEDFELLQFVTIFPSYDVAT